MSDSLELLRNVRSKYRLRSSQLVERAFGDVQPIESSCPALYAARCRLDDRLVGVIAQQKPTADELASGSHHNFGMMSAAGYWHAIELLESFAAEGRAVLSLIDTPGADPSRRGSEDLLAWAISDCISAFLTTRAPTVSLILGEGGSGGALALQVADVRLMASDALYSVIAPESCSAILFRDGDHVDEALAVLRPWASDMRRLKLVDDVVELPASAAVDDHAAAAAALRSRLERGFEEASSVAASERMSRRRARILALPSRREDATALATTSAAPAVDNVSPAQPRAPSRFVKLTATEDVYSALQHAYFSSMRADDDATEGRLLCPRRAGGCGAVVEEAAYVSAGWACPICGMGDRLDAARWSELLFDERSFQELWPDLDASDLDLGPYDTSAYRALRQRARRTTGASESLRVGVAHIEGSPCAVALFEFAFLGGTLGVVAGEKIRRVCGLALAEELPLVAVTSSGGARMQEGTLALAQMAKANAAVLELMEAGLPFISVLADPCTGGALGSYATCATAVLAEPRALIAFAGPRVLALSGLSVDPASLRSEPLCTWGGIDEVIERKRLRGRVSRHLKGSDVEGNRRGARHARYTRAEMLQRRMDRSVTALTDAAITLLEEEDEAGDVAGVDAVSARACVDAARATAVSQLADLALVTIPTLLERASQSRDPRTRANAIEVLSRFPRSGDKRLEKALIDPHHRVRANACVSLLRADPSHADASAVLVGLLASSRSLERRAGLYSVIRLPLPRWRRSCLDLLGDDNVHVRAAAIVALLALGAVDEAKAAFNRLNEDAGELAVAVAKRMQPLLAPDRAEALRQWLEGAGPASETAPE